MDESATSTSRILKLISGLTRVQRTRPVSQRDTTKRPVVPLLIASFSINSPSENCNILCSNFRLDKDVVKPAPRHSTALHLISGRRNQLRSTWATRRLAPLCLCPGSLCSPVSPAWQRRPRRPCRVSINRRDCHTRRRSLDVEI